MAPASTSPRPTWANTWRFASGAAVCLAIGWFAFLRGQPVPILSGVDLAFHEASHFFASFLPRVAYFAAGSVGQILWPLGIGIAFLLINKDPLGAGLCFAWAGAAAQNVSEYIADAPTMALPLIGGQHDWNTILGPEHLDALGAAQGLARVVWVFGLAMWVGGIGMCLLGPRTIRRREALKNLREQPAVDRSANASPAVEDSTRGWAIVPPWEAGSADPEDRTPSESPAEPPDAAG